MIEVSELFTIAGGALGVGVTSQVLIGATTTRTRLRHERERIACLVSDDGTESWKARGRAAAKIVAADPSSCE